MYKYLIILSSIVILSGCFSSDDQSLDSDENAEAVNSLDEKQAIEETADELVLAEQLAIPWAIDKYDDTFYVTERGGRLLEIDSNGDVNEQELSLNEEVLHYGEGGLLGFILTPDYEESGEAYLYHTYQDDNNNVFNRVVLVQQEGEQWEETEALLEYIPGAQFHNGGRLAIGPDQKLYITTGDAVVRNSAQDVTSLAGKILRMNLDGTIPSDNPFDDSYVYSYGHRNPQGLAWSEEGTMYSTEHGESAHDEINLIEPGQNYGWPVIEGDADQDDMVPPIYHTGDTTWAPSGIGYYDGKLYIAGLRGSQIIAYDIEANKAETFYEDQGRMRDIYIEDGFLYTITSNRDGRGDPDEQDDVLLRLKLD
ncbi:PQQ-dependent sugar dehydrogenase [Aquisalibacillus elongatus]|uniref:Glucose/arabinose dehydrogenase n=1 Tax=Aquisalibacillus elongatus TaxID=485577 RepID=A0A3N5C410_9BACI|nr:PQQ-dependent sugar dehydrogenase [Aquisalibacillus elongatus]RPF51041.1 glucose/arabinose dehydrogenase [Aquisalibacillus elongatus]